MNNSNNIFLANRYNGRIHVCGVNTNGRMGVNSFDENMTGLKSVSGFENKSIHGVAYGTKHNAILTTESSGNLYMCGGNEQGALGMGDSVDDISVFRQTTYFDSKKVIQVCCGDYFTLCITNEPSDNVYATGNIYDYRSGFRVDINSEPTVNGDHISIFTYNIRNFTRLNASLFRDISGEYLSQIHVIGGACGPTHTIVYSNERFYATGNNQYGQLTYDGSITVNGFTEMQFENGFSWTNRRPIGVSTCGSSTVCLVYNSISFTNEVYVCGMNYSGKFGVSFEITPQFRVLTYFNPANIDKNTIVTAHVTVNRLVIMTDNDINNLWFGGIAMSEPINDMTVDFTGSMGQINSIPVPYDFIRDGFVGDLRDKRIVSFQATDTYMIALTDELENNVYFCGTNDIVKLFSTYYDLPDIRPAKLSFINIFNQPSNFFEQIDASSRHVTIIDTFHVNNLEISYNTISPNISGITDFAFSVNNMLYSTVYTSHYDAMMANDGPYVCSFEIQPLNESFFGTYELTPSTGTQYVIKLEPEGSVFDDYVNFTMTIDRNIYKDFIMYLHSVEGDETIQIPDLADITSEIGDVYFEFTNSEKTQIKIYTKHFSTLMITSTDLNCLTRGTTVLTPYGYIAIEKLKKDDYVLTSDNRKSKIKKIHRIFVHSNKETNPYIIPKNAFGKNYPLIETVISGLHKIKFNDVWIVPKKFDFKQKTSSKIIEYFHIELENYLTDHLVINSGLIVESFRPSNKTNNIECRRRVKSGVKLVIN